MVDFCQIKYKNLTVFKFGLNVLKRSRLLKKYPTVMSVIKLLANI